MRKLVAMVGVVTALGIAAGVVWSLCAGPALAETLGPVREVAPPQIEEWDFDEAVERARAAEKREPREVVDQVQVTLDEMVKAIIQEQPWYRTRPQRAKRLAGIIFEAATEHGQDTWIALAIAYKESSLSPGVGRAKVTGELGEEGYFQIMPRSYPRKQCAKGRLMGNARANADTAMCWLAFVRAKCETDDPSQYVPAYSMKTCPEPGRGHRLRPSKRARAVLCRMVGEDRCEAIWPS